MLPYPITFFCTDLISELYGRRRANLLVWVGLGLNLWVVTILWLGGVLPGFERVLTFDMGGTSTDVALCDGAVPVRAQIRGHHGRPHQPGNSANMCGAPGKRNIRSEPLELGDVV